MLREFRVDNFKSLINIVFEPRRINLLLGANNSGKTNLCQALKFVSRSAVVPLDRCADDVARGRFGMTNFALDKSTTDFHIRADVPHGGDNLLFDYELTIAPPRSGVVDAAVRVVREELTVSGGGFTDETPLLENDAGLIRLLDETSLENSTSGEVSTRAAYHETVAPVDATMLQRIYDEKSNALAIRFKNYLASWTYYDLSPAAMRQTVYMPGAGVLNPDGGNLASALFLLKTGRERDYRRLLDVTRQIEPRLDLINFLGGAENSVLMFFEDSDGNAVPAVSASNGTLRFLAMAYILLVQRQADCSPLCIIEEPENGIHVNLLQALLGMVDPTSDGPQLVFTTHAPYFIDTFDEHPEGLFVLNQRQGHTAIARPDAGAIKARLEKFPLGEQHFREMLR